MNITGLENSTTTTALHRVQRLYLPEGDMDRRCDELIDFCQRTGTQEVLLFTTSYDLKPSFQPVSELQAYADQLRPRMERLRHAGLVVDINVLQTLGHIYFPLAMQEQFPFQRRVYLDGKVSTEGACPLCGELRQWIIASYRIWASLAPRVIFVDDDFRTNMQGISCVCPLHLNRISALAGREVAREEVSAAVYSGSFPAPEVRQHYFDATTTGLADLSTIIRECVAAIDPNIRLGVMTAHQPWGAIGTDWAPILKALSGHRPPLVRPQSPMYSEGFLRDMPVAFTNPSRQRAVLPADSECWPEIESYPYGPHARSAQTSLVHAAVLVAQGFNHLAVNVFDMYGTAMSTDAALITLWEQRRNFLDRLHALVPEGQPPLGISVVNHANLLRVQRVQNKDLFGSHALANRLPNLGLPMTDSGEGPWRLAVGDDVLALTDAEIDRLLSSGLLMDATAASALAVRGFAARIGVEVGAAIAADDLGYEEFVPAGEVGESPGTRFPLRSYIAPGDWRSLRATVPSARALSHIRNWQQAQMGPGLLLTENHTGERFGVVAFSGGGNRVLMENRLRAEQIRTATTWIARRDLPLVCDPVAAYLWPIVTHAGNGRLLALITNLSTDVVDVIPVIVARDPEGAVVQLDDHGDLRTIPATFKGTRGTARAWDIQCTLVPLATTAVLL